MAQTLSITCKKNAVQIIVDGNEIHDVLSYKLEESPEAVTLTLVIDIKGGLEVQM